jgi:long-chain fatty acid transport protein
LWQCYRLPAEITISPIQVFSENTRMRRVGRCALWLLLGVPAGLGAQGFGVYEHGTCTMGRAGVAAANPCNDGSAIFFNPAGLARLAGATIHLGGTLILPTGGFTDDLTATTVDAPSQKYLVPSFYAGRAFSDKVAAGIGVFAPYGLGTRWPSDASFPGRFLGYKTDLKSIYVQPTVGYKITPKLEVGVGVSYIHANVELHQRVDLSTQVVPSASLPAGTRFSALGIVSGTDFADAALEASGNGMAVNFGAIWHVTDKLSIGGHWLTRKTIALDGTVDFSQVLTGLTLPPGNPLSPTGSPLPVDALVSANFGAGGPLVDGPAHTEVTLPPQGSLGVAYQAGPRWTVMADYQLVVWGWFNQLVIDFESATTPDIVLYEGYRDTHGIRLAVEHQRSDNLTLRGGYLYHSAAAPAVTVTPLLPEGARNEVTLGAGFKLANNVHADLAYQYIRQNDRRGRVHEANVGNTGIYTFTAHLLGASVVLTF